VKRETPQEEAIVYVGHVMGLLLAVQRTCDDVQAEQQITSALAHLDSAVHALRHHDDEG
jgi:NADH:ubiquinone oxidoreductase subunit 6 (subunit J)